MACCKCEVEYSKNNNQNIKVVIPTFKPYQSPVMLLYFTLPRVESDADCALNNDAVL